MTARPLFDAQFGARLEAKLGQRFEQLRDAVSVQRAGLQIWGLERVGKFLRLLWLLRALQINLVAHHDERLLINRLENLVPPARKANEGFGLRHVVDQSRGSAPAIEASAYDLEAILSRHVPDRELYGLPRQVNGLSLKIDSNRGHASLLEFAFTETPNQRRLADVAVACDDYLQDGNATQRLLVTTEKILMGKYELIRINGWVA